MSDSTGDSVLDALAGRGLEAVAASRFDDVAHACENRAGTSGDARYAVLEEMFREVLNWWSEHDERGGIPTPVAQQIDEAIRQRLPTVLGAADPRGGYAAASELRTELRQLLQGPGEWTARGYLKPLSDS